MNPEDLKLELKTLTEGLEGKSKLEVKAAIEAFETKHKEAMTLEIKTAVDAVKLESKEVTDEMQKHLDKLDIKLQDKNTQEAKQGDSIAIAIKESFEEIKGVKKGNAIDIKAVGNMTLGVNLTGDEPRDYNFDVVMIPNQMVNVDDLVGNVTISGGTYTYVRETGSEGAIGTPTEGLAKGQIDYDFTMVDLSTDFIAGFTRYSKKMRNNLPFLESFIPNALRRDYAKQENSDFNGVLEAGATASSQIITGQNKIEMLIAEIATLEGIDHAPNAIAVTVADYWDILITEKSTGAGYGLPGIVTQENGVLRINGIPLVKATWMTANKYFVGDWSRINKVTTEGLSLEFSEVEGTNFIANNITARIEAQVGLALEQPAAIIFGDFTAV